MEITYQNKREDLDALYDYLLLNTKDGEQVGKSGLGFKLWKRMWPTMLISALFWGATGNGESASQIAGALIFLVFCFTIFVPGLKPLHYYGKQIYKNKEKTFTSKSYQLIELKRTLVLDEEWLKMHSTEAVHRYRWRTVDKIGLMPNFIYIHIEGCPITHVPKRDFSSEEKYIEFGKRLIELKDKYKDEPIGAE